MPDAKLYYPFNYFYDAVSTVAIYGSNAPIVVKGNLVLRAYFKDDEKKELDIEHTSEYVRDTIFYETNKVLREKLDDPYNGKRELCELTIPQIGSEYRIIYNMAEVPSDRYDDLLTIISHRDPYAHGVAIIMKRCEDGSIQYLKEREAHDIVRKLKELAQ